VVARSYDGAIVSEWSTATMEQMVAAPESCKPLAVTAVAAPTRAQNVAITVSLTAAAEVDASIYNLAGREIARIPLRTLPAGINTVWWNGRSLTGTRVPLGQYLLRLTARTADGSCANYLTPLRP
jgi:flagellar hook assembly protein FlgD